VNAYEVEAGIGVIQVTLCDPCLSALSVRYYKKALCKYTYLYLMHRKVKSFKQRVFLSEQRVVSKITSVQNAAFRPRHSAIIVLPLVLPRIDDMLFEISPKIRCSDVSSRCCCYETTRLVLSQIKTFYCSQLRIDKT